MVVTFYGNGPIMANILTSIVYILNSADYHTLLVLMMVLAGSLMVWQWHMINSNGGSGTHGLLVAIGTVVILYYGGWQPQETLVVYDPLNNFQTAVTNVPEAFAQIVHISNKITNGFADLFDQGFASSNFPDQMSYNNGMTNGLMAIDSLGQLQPGDQFLTENISNYFKDCVFPAMLMNNGSGPSVNDIAQSTDLLQTIQTNLSNAWTTTYYNSANPGGESVTCTQMYTNVDNDITNAINSPTGSISQAYANQMMMGMGGSGAYTNPSFDTGLLGTAAGYIINGAVTSQQLVSQAVLINAFDPALQNFAAQNGLNPNALSSSLTQSILQTTTTMNASYALAQEILPMAFLIISALIYAIMPIMFAMMFIPQLTKKFGMMAFDLLMWIAFWAPLASVVNAIVQASAAQTFNVMGVSAIEPQNWPYLMGHTYTLMAIAGDMMFSVPVLAFALASGSSYAMTSVAGSITGLSRGAAASAASSMSTMGGAEGSQAQANQSGGLGIAAKANNESPQVAAENLMDMQGANSAGFLNGFLSTGGFEPSMNAAANEKAKSISAGDTLENTTTAAAIGSMQTQQSMGKILGDYQSYKQAVADGNFNGTFSQFEQLKEQYGSSSNYEMAQNMQKLADQYFGGNLDGEMNYIQSVSSQKSLGGAMGTNQALQAYEQNGGKGGIVGMTAFNQNISTQSQTAGNQGKVAAAKTAGESFFQYEKQAAQGQSLKQWVGSEAFMKQAQELGINPIIAGEVNNMLATTEKGITMGSPAEAEKIGQMQAYMLKGELDGLGGNPSQAEFVSATDMAKKLGYALGVGGPAGGEMIGTRQGQFDAAKWQEIGNMAGTLGRYEAEGLISKYQVDNILAKGRNLSMVKSMEYEAINSRMNNLLPTLRSAIMGKGKLTQADAGLINNILQAPKDDQVLQSVKQQLLQHAAKYEADMYSRQTSSNVNAHASVGYKDKAGLDTSKSIIGLATGIKAETEIDAEGGVSGQTASATATNLEYKKVLERLEHTDFSHMNAQGFVNKVNEIGKQVQGNPIENVMKGVNHMMQKAPLATAGHDWFNNHRTAGSGGDPSLPGGSNNPRIGGGGDDNPKLPTDGSNPALPSGPKALPSGPKALPSSDVDIPTPPMVE